MTPSIPIFANTQPNPTQGSSQVAAAQLRGQKEDRLMRLKFEIWFMANALKGIGGTDYTSALTNATGSLHKLAATTLVGFDRDMLMALEAFMWNRAATASGSTPGTTTGVWSVSNAKFLRDTNEDDLERMRLTLLDKILAIKF